MGKFPKVNTSALDAANYILELAEADKIAVDPITLQKLLYYCQCWSLNDGARLFDDRVEAWKHGPVVRSVWKAYSGSSNIRPADEPRFYELSADQQEQIQSVWQALKGSHGLTLSERTHEAGTAWSKARGDLPETAESNREIAPHDMAEDAARIWRETERALTDGWDEVIRHQQR